MRTTVIQSYPKILSTFFRYCVQYNVRQSWGEMTLRIGQLLRGRKGTYRLVEALKAPTVFKAQVLPNSSVKSGLYGTSVRPRLVELMGLSESQKA